MTGPMKDYEAIDRGYRSNRAPAPAFRLRGQEWTPVGETLPAGLYIDLGRVGEGEASDSKVAAEFALFVLGEQQYERWQEVISDRSEPLDPMTMQAIVQDWVAHYTGFPTGRPSLSGARPSGTTSTSKVVSLSPVTESAG